MIKPLSQKNFFRISLLLMLFVGSFLGVKADETPPSEATGEDVTVEDSACAENLAQSSFLILDAYQSFIDQYTKIDAPTSEQFENALLFYRYVEDSIRKLYDSSAEISKFNGTVAFANQELSTCRKVRDGIIEYSRKMLPIFLKGATTSKTTFKFVDGLKVMNEDLRDMSILFQNTFPAQFTEMYNGLPCYAHECLSK